MLALLFSPAGRRVRRFAAFAAALLLFAWFISAWLLVGSLWAVFGCLIFGMGLLGLVPAAAAYREGRSFLQWWLYGGVDFFGALSKSQALQPIENPDGSLRRCPECGRWIHAETNLCSYCENEVTPLSREAIVEQRRAAREAMRRADQLPRWLAE